MLPRYAPLLATAVVAIALSACPREDSKTMESSMKQRPADSNKHLAPKTINGWTATGKDHRYGPKTIFDYLNGGAEAYLDYGFVSLFVREYHKPRNPSISLLIFDMSSASEAFGIFTLEREGDSAGIGEDSDFDGSLLRFWRGRYFVSITCQRQTSATKRAVLELGRAVAGAIKGAGKRPSPVAWLPAEGLDKTSVRYLHTLRTLSQLLPRLADQDILGLDRSTQVVLADYDQQSVIIVVYPRSAQATRAHQRLTRIKRPPHDDRRCGSVLISVLGPGPRQRTLLLDRVAARTPECKDGR